MKKTKPSYSCVEHVELRRLLSTVFVDATAPGSTHDGLSWATAYTDLQVALAAATSGTTIEVGQGTYKPTTGTDRAVSFHLKTGVTLQGGYAGTGQPNPDARNPAIFPSILSGDIGAAGNADNSYHVVYARSVDNTAVLDGFTITGGNANVSGNDSNGGGIFDLLANPTINDCTISGNNSTGSGAGIATEYSSPAPTLTDCTISGNTSGGRGGGLYNVQSSPTVTDCTFSENSSNQGGGISNKKSSPALRDCTITGNTATTGGAIANYNASSPAITDCVLAGNTATESGGGLWDDLNSSPIVINCTISGNTATTSGGAMYNLYAGATLTNCTLSGNTARYGGALYNNGNSSSTVTNCILWDNTASFSDDEIGNGFGGTSTESVSFSDIDQSGFAGSNNNIIAIPMFLREVGTNGASDFGDLRLGTGSPAINTGTNAAIAGTNADLDGNTRIIGSAVDMGAYEARFLHLAFDTAPSGNFTAGGSLPIEVDIEDGNGQVATTDNSSVTVHIVSGPAGASIHGTFILAADHGAAVFSGVNITQAGTYAISASDGSLPGDTTDSFTISPAAAASLTITQQPGDAVAGNAISSVTVEVEDQFGNPVDGASVNLSLATSPAGSTLSGTLSVSTTNGQATFNTLSLNQAGNFTLAANDGSLPSVNTNSFAVSYARPELVFVAAPSSATAGAKISPIHISPEDIHGNPLTSNKSSIKLTVSLGGKVISSITAMLKKGVAVFNPPAIQKAGTYKLTAADPSVGPAVSTTFTITAAKATRITFNSQTFKVTHSKPFNVVVKLFDRYGNLATNNNSTVKLLLASHPPKTTFTPLTATVTNGMADFVGVTLGVRGQYAIEVTDQKLKAVSGTFIVK